MIIIPWLSKIWANVKKIDSAACLSSPVSGSVADILNLIKQRSYHQGKLDFRQYVFQQADTEEQALSATGHGILKGIMRNQKTYVTQITKIVIDGVTYPTTNPDIMEKWLESYNKYKILPMDIFYTQSLELYAKCSGVSAGEPLCFMLIN